MNAGMAMEVIEALEPYARRLLERAETETGAYRDKWNLAIRQALLVVRAYGAPPVIQPPLFMLEPRQEEM